MRSRTSAPVYATTQGYLILSAVPALARDKLHKSLIEAGELDVAGDYECEFALDGMNIVEAELMPSAVTGSFAPSLKAMRYHGAASARTADVDAGGNFQATVSEVLTVDDLRGKLVGKVTFTIPGGGSITFDPGDNPASPTAIAEVNGL